MAIDTRGITISDGPLLKALEAHGWCHIDGVPYADDEAAAQALIDAYSIADAIAERQAECSAMAKAFRDKVVASVSPGEMAAWSIKRNEMTAYVETGDAAQAPMLAAEAQARGISLDAMVAKVQASATAFATLEALIAGNDGKHRDALASLTTFDEVYAYDLTVGWPEV